MRITKPGTFPRCKVDMGGPPKIGVLTPPNHPFVHRVWNHYFHHPFWDTPIFGNIHMIPWAKNARYSHMHCSEFMHTDEISHLQG